MSDIVLEASGIVKYFPGVMALGGVDLKIKRGEIHAIVGENGAGKSTLMLTLSGVHRPDAGQIRIDGQEIRLESPKDAAAKGIGIVFQELSLVPELSIAENIFANRQPIGKLGLIDRKRMARDTQDLLALFDLKLDPELPVKRLSVALQQVVEILKALSLNPKVLILDEPTSSLTEHEICELFVNLNKLKARGIACIYISHHLHEIFEIADSVTVLRDGHFVCESPVKDINEDWLVSKMVGRSIANMYGNRQSDELIGKLRLDVQKISREGIFSDISFQVHTGEIVAFAGLVGAGRTEVGRALFGAEPFESGTVSLDGRTVAPRSPREAIECGIGYLSEDRKNQGLFLNTSIQANLVANHLDDFCRALPLINEGKTRAWAEAAVSDYHIATPGIDRMVKNLSGGNQQKVLAAMWIGIGPKVLIVDEPTRGVDIGAKAEIYALIRKLAKSGTAVIMISSDLMEVLGMADRIVVMKSGTVAGELDGKTASEEAVIALAAGTKRETCA